MKKTIQKTNYIVTCEITETTKQVFKRDVLATNENEVLAIVEKLDSDHNNNYGGCTADYTKTLLTSTRDYTITEAK